MTDYEKWKEWLNGWAIEYEETGDFNGVKSFEISGWYAAMYVNFNSDTERYLGVMITDG